MNVLIYDNVKKKLVPAIIVLARIGDLPFKKDGWSFNWRVAYKNTNSDVHILKLKEDEKSIEGLIQISVFEGVMVMNLLELAPHNIGRNEKRYEYVAGCLISFACYESFKLETNYKGFISFETKKKLRNWYKDNYYAEDAMGKKMFIWPDDGIKLINEYLNRKT